MSRRIDFLKNVPDQDFEAVEKLLAKKEEEELESVKIVGRNRALQDFAAREGEGPAEILARMSDRGLRELSQELAGNELRPFAILRGQVEAEIERRENQYARRPGDTMEGIMNSGYVGSLWGSTVLTSTINPGNITTEEVRGHRVTHISG